MSTLTHRQFSLPAVGASHPGLAYRVFKRMLDITAAMAGLALLAPLLLGCAAWIKWCDGGPVLYTQWRVGRYGWLFRIYKLRTMTQNAEEPGGARFASTDDHRILPGCGWMRRSHVDELPQLWNILIGEMSLVGPRPERPEMFEQLCRAMPRFQQRLTTPPGLTGLAQVMNGYTNDTAGARRKLAYDLCYLKRRGIIEEIRLVLATLPKVWDHAAL